MNGRLAVPNGRKAGRERNQKEILVFLNQQPCRLLSQPLPWWSPEQQKKNEVFLTEDLVVDAFGQTVYKNGRYISFGKIEFSLLVHLIRNSTLCCTRQSLREVTEMRFMHRVVENTLSKHINRIRTKLGSKSTYILTCNGLGYKWKPPVSVMYACRSLED